MNNLKISILIVTWNSWNDLKRCLESIRRIEFRGVEVVVVDNGSSDETVSNIKSRFPEVNLMENRENLGLPKAINLGWYSCRGEYVMLLDVDTEISPNSVDSLFNFMQSNSEVSLVAPRIHTPEGEIEQSARNLPSVMNGLFGRQTLLTRIFPDNLFTRRYLMSQNLGNKEPFQVEQVSAACMFARRSLIDEVGPWDEGYRCYWVDSDWCSRLKQHDKAIFCLPETHITHYENNRAEKKKSAWRIWHFHTGAFRLYRTYNTLGVFDPRSILAGIALLVRASLALCMNAFIRENNSKQAS